MDGTMTRERASASEELRPMAIAPLRLIILSHGQRLGWLPALDPIVVPVLAA